MSRRAEKYTVFVFMLLSAFVAYRTIERRAWINEVRYSDGVDRQNMAYIHKFMGGVFR